MGAGKAHTRVGRIARIGVAGLACFVLANCAGSGKFSSKVDPKYGVSSSPRVVEIGEPVPKGGGTYRVGKPYEVAGRVYVPEENTGYRAEGLASWYGEDFHGRLTANGEVFDMTSISAAHPTLPMPCYARVTNLNNGRSIVVRVNDRGPYHPNRVIDVSVRTAKLLGFYDNGVARVRVEYVGRAALEGSDDRQLTATLRQNEPAPAPSLVMVASAKPFVPEIADPVPSGSGPIPIPPDRPFTLGQGSVQASAAGTAGEMTSTARAAPPRTRAIAAASETSASLPSAASPSTSPVSAFAPTRYDAGTSFMGGRGLY